MLLLLKEFQQFPLHKNVLERKKGADDYYSDVDFYKVFAQN